jgi:hypothetical protein
MKNFTFSLIFFLLCLGCKKNNISPKTNLLNFGVDKFSKIDSKIHVRNTCEIDILLSAKFDSIRGKDLVYSKTLKIELKTNTDFTLLPENLKRDLEFEVIKVSLDTLTKNVLRSGEFITKDRLKIRAYNKMIYLAQQEIELCNIYNSNQKLSTKISLDLKYRK